MGFRARAEAWRARQSWAQKGYGCVALILFGCFCLAGIGGAIMGDYIGPPEGREEDQRVKRNVMIAGFLGFISCATVGSWLVKPRKP